RLQVGPLTKHNHLNASRSSFLLMTSLWQRRRPINIVRTFTPRCGLRMIGTDLSLRRRDYPRESMQQRCTPCIQRQAAIARCNWSGSLFAFASTDSIRMNNVNRQEQGIAQMALSDRALASWEIASIASSALIAEWMYAASVGAGKWVTAIPVSL